VECITINAKKKDGENSWPGFQQSAITSFTLSVLSYRAVAIQSNLRNIKRTSLIN
jgi:hypothetical protein